MGRIKKYSADFETTTDPNDCRVWAAGICEIGKPKSFVHYNNLTHFMRYCFMQGSIIMYFHNLKFDGEFILAWLFENGYTFTTARDAPPKTFTTLISDMGQFYSIKIKTSKTDHVTLYDSLKILPFKVSEIAKAFKLPMPKLSIDYAEKREVNHVLTKHEVDYLRNDVLIVASALNTLFEQKLTKMTQGSNALSDYKAIVTERNFNKWFPTPEYDRDIRDSYKGGFTYLNPRFKNKDIKSGLVLDVNSLYPSVMYNSKLPYGEGKHFEGKYETDTVYDLYTQKLTCVFKIKPNKIPTIQIKQRFSSFLPTEYVTTTNGEEVTLCLTSIDLTLFFAHYNATNIEYHDGWKFKSTIGLFKDYIDKWYKIKVEASETGNAPMRTLSKLMLNALYGKFALNPAVRSKYPEYDNGVIKYKLGPKETRSAIYIPMGTFITAWARYKTITSAQKVYKRFIYADTDSLHLTGTELPNSLDIDPNTLGAWKHENNFTRAKFIRQKTYAEEILTTESNMKAVTEEMPLLANNYYKIDGQWRKMEITCAGMPIQCHGRVTWENFNENSINFEGKIKPRHVRGGIVLEDTPFTIK